MSWGSVDRPARVAAQPLARPPTLPLSGWWYVAAELGCLALGVVLAGSTLRLFSDTASVLDLALVATAAWALAVVIRRSPLPGWSGDLLHLLVGALALLAIVAPEQRWGLLPTPGSVLTLTSLLRDDFSQFERDIAPLDPRTGHLVALAALIWILALFCSTAAMRFRSPVQGAVPHIVATIGLGFVARSSWRYPSALLLLLGVGIYALTQVAWRNSAYNWVPRTSAVTPARLASGAGIVVLGVVVAAVSVPVLPVGVDPVVDVRRGGLGDGGPRTVVSPFVEIGADLGPRSDELLFTVEADTSQYWRLTALDTYDAENGIWVLSNSYSPLNGPLGSGQPAEPPTDLEIRGLGGIWVPSPADPITAETELELNWDPKSGSLIKRSGDLSDGDRIEFRTASDAGTPDPATLENSLPGPASGDLTDPGGAPAELRVLAADLAAGLSPYQSLLALQNHFRDTFAYDETVNYSGDADPLDAFLTARSGFCQQFSTAFALGARSLGFAARVVVGFTPGDSEAGLDDGDVRTFAVRGRHAHAWPEVLFRGIGWVAFEPTPGRGDPRTSEVTGVAPAQAAPPTGSTGLESLDSTTTVTEAPSTSVDGGAEQPADSPSEVTADAPEPTAEVTGGGVSWLWVLAAALVIFVVSMATVPIVRRRMRTTGATDPVQRAWDDTIRHLGDRGFTCSASETPLEFAERCNKSLRVPELRWLAALESARRWSGTPNTAWASQQAAEAADAIVNRLAEDPESVPVTSGQPL